MVEMGTVKGVDEAVLEVCWEVRVVYEEGREEAAVGDAFEHYFDGVGVRARRGYRISGQGGSNREGTRVEKRDGEDDVLKERGFGEEAG